MSIDVRAAQPDEYPSVRDILLRAFATDDEARLWDQLVAHDTRLRPQDVRLAVLDGRPVACTVVLPRQIRVRRGWVPGAIVTLVACHPDQQRQGYGGRTVRDALAYLAATDLALGLLYGHPTYYPRFGFVPVLPAWLTTLAVAAVPSEPRVALEPLASAEHVAALHALYTAQMGTYPCAVARTLAPWEWQPRHPERHALLLLPSQQGYAFVGDEPAQDTLVVYEAAAREDAGELLRGLAHAAGRRALGQLRLRMPPDHALVRAALAHGATQSAQPPAAGMAAVTQWAPLLPPAYRVDGAGLAYEDRQVLHAGQWSLTELVLGARGIDDLLLTPECHLAGEADLAQLRRDFPPRYPRWSLAPFWF